MKPVTCIVGKVANPNRGHVPAPRAERARENSAAHATGLLDRSADRATSVTVDVRQGDVKGISRSENVRR